VPSSASRQASTRERGEQLNSGLLWEAIEIIQDIPEKKISLGIWQRGIPDEENPELYIPAARFIDVAHKKLICCPGGWLALHPDMHAAGLVANVMGTPSLAHWRDHSDDDGDGYASGTNKNVKPAKGSAFTALAQTFDMKGWEAKFLFGQRFLAERAMQVSDKDLWMKRARNMINRSRK
jgi:hypothetical protein